MYIYIYIYIQSHNNEGEDKYLSICLCIYYLHSYPSEKKKGNSDNLPDQNIELNGDRLQIAIPRKILVQSKGHVIFLIHNLLLK